MTNTDGSAQACNEADSPRAVFVDIDGTLCDSRQRIPRSAIDALHEVRSNGHRLFACTGRSAPEVYPRFWDVGFEGLVGGAGGYARVGSRVLVDERMPREHVEVLTALWEELDAFYIWQGPDQMGPSEGYLDFFVPRAGTHPEDWIEYAQSITPFIVDVDDGTFTKVTAYVPPEKASLERVTAALPAGYRAIIGSVGAAGYVPFEVVPAPLSKAVGISGLRIYRHSPLPHRCTRRLQQRRRGRGNRRARHQYWERMRGPREGRGHRRPQRLRRWTRVGFECRRADWT